MSSSLLPAWLHRLGPTVVQRHSDGQGMALVLNKLPVTMLNTLWVSFKELMRAMPLCELAGLYSDGHLGIL